jgi:hypothetical protein
MADAREHSSEPETDLTLADLLGTLLDPFGRLVHHLGLVGGPRGPARESQDGERLLDNAGSSQNASDTAVRPCVGYLTPVRAKTEQWSGRPSQVSVFIDPTGVVFELLFGTP